MKVLKGLFIFAIGAAAGSVATYYYAKDKFEKQNNEEQEALLEHYGINRNVEIEEAHAKSEKNLNKPDISEYKRTIERVQYNTISKPEVKEDIPKVSSIKKPRSIEITNFDDLGMVGYEVQTLELYSDGVIATEDDNEVVDADAYFGDLDFDKIFEESEYGDCVYIRNHELKLDIELCKNAESYVDTIASIYSED